MNTRTIAVVILMLAAFCSNAQPHPQDEGYNYLKDISYADETDAYRKERCKLDVYYPDTDKGFATLVWYHGGGLE